jgi:hypothetical protein
VPENKVVSLEERSKDQKMNKAVSGTVTEVGHRIGNSVLIIRQHPPTDDPNPRITLEVQDAREIEKRLTERAVTISDPVKLYEDKFWVGGFLDS